MTCRLVTIFGALMAGCLLGWAQDGPQTVNSPAQQEPLPPERPASHHFPFEVAGYVSFRRLNDDALNKRHFYRDYSASLFVSKTLGRWRFHSEFNAEISPEYDSDGIHLIARRPSLSVKLDSAFVNYNARDWLQIQGGLLFIPTYWRTHRYQSTTLTVDEPLIDQNVFPTALKGGAMYGEKYWGESGISYIVYGGVDQQAQFDENTSTVEIEPARAIGGKVTIHVPSHQLLRVFDVSLHRLHRVVADGKADETYGVELQLSRNQFEILAEFDHASLDLVHGVRAYIRQGYYIQPSYRITPKLFAVFRYDHLNRDSRYLDENSLGRQLVGLTYRPIPLISLKVNAERYEPQAGRLPAYYGLTASLVWFFRLP
jgi:hypothetical protein